MDDAPSPNDELRHSTNNVDLRSVPPLATPPFRLHLAAAHETVAIPARKDTKNGGHVILLDDIQLVYNNTKHILNDGTTVPF
ncbi:hypothetical protein BGZ65_000329, partial [Modicella reniformis]